MMLRLQEVFIAVFPSLLNEKWETNSMGISFLRMFDMTNDSGLFSEVNLPDYLPLYEAKMIEDYDHRFAGVIHYSDRIRTGEPEEATLEEHSNPKFSPRFRYWVKKTDITKAVNTLGSQPYNGLLVYKDITTASSEKTFKSTILPFSGVGNSAPIINISKDVEICKKLCLLANFNSFVMDYVARQKIGYLHINYFVLKQFPVLTPSKY